MRRRSTPKPRRAHRPPNKPAENARKAWSRKWMAAWLNAYAEKGTVTAACKVARISRTTAYEARERDAEFAAEWEKAETETTEILEKTLYEIATTGSGSPQMRALEFALKSRRPSKYRESVKVEHGGAIDTSTHEKLDEEILKTNADLRTEVDRLTAKLADVADRDEAKTPGAPEGDQVAASS